MPKFLKCVFSALYDFIIWLCEFFVSFYVFAFLYYSIADPGLEFDGFEWITLFICLVLLLFKCVLYFSRKNYLKVSDFLFGKEVLGND